MDIQNETPGAVPKTRMLPDIPIEICRHIASFLDLSSALRLMRTCRALRHAGEIRAYSCLDLTGTWKAEPDVQPRKLNDDDYQTRAAIVDVKIKHALAMLRKYPYRKAYVTGLRIEPSDGGPNGYRIPSLLSLLELVSNQLFRLEILPLPSRNHWSPEQTALYGTANFFSEFILKKLRFDRLTRLKYVCPREGLTVFDVWMASMPNLEDLELSAAETPYPFTPSPFLDNPDIPFTFHHLKRITLDNLDEDNHVLPTILLHAPNLMILRLRGHWTPSSGVTSMVDSAESLSVKTVITSDDDLTYKENTGISFHLFGKVGLYGEELATEFASLPEWTEVNFRRFQLPQNPFLRRMTFITPRSPALSEFASCPLVSTLPTTIHIPSLFLHNLRRTPLLSSILYLHIEQPFPRPYSSSFVEPTYFVPPTDWIEQGHRGIVIRQYEHRHGEEATELWHIRSLSRCVPDGKNFYMGMRRYLGDWTRFEGRTVPRYVLEAVYREAGVDMGFMEGGRGLPLGQGDGPWRILREWRDAVGDESDVEDEFVLDGTEDDDLLTDEED